VERETSCSFKCGGIPIQIKDGRNGFLVEPHDTEKFAEKIKFCKNLNWQRRWVKTARRW